jgi:hypothetical protein
LTRENVTSLALSTFCFHLETQARLWLAGDVPTVLSGPTCAEPILTTSPVRLFLLLGLTQERGEVSVALKR